jgi:hypothetical protein
MHQEIKPIFPDIYLRIMELIKIEEVEKSEGEN